MPIAELFLSLHKHRTSADFSESTISELDAIASLFPLNFDETGNQIKQILEKRYTDGISGFKNVKVEGSKIAGIFYDIVSPSLTKSFNFTILVDDETAKKYKPSMSEDEANEYTKNSFTGNLSFYHGNSQSVVDSIKTDGAIPERNDTGMYGKGFYLAASKDEAEYYALTRSGQDTAVIASKVNVKNPYVCNSQDIQDLKDNLFKHLGDDNSSVVTEYFKAKGHDSIYLQDMGYFVTFDTKQTVTYSEDKRTVQQSEAIASSRPSAYTIDTLGNAAKSDTGKKLLKANRSN
ncbi:MAG: hypothetical protein V7L23_29805 [Nostoc sp.]|uniref:hypothetical protein n=1 Tax=Nostoc sp. TaxID=1180 RepID=UPI002FF13070